LNRFLALMLAGFIRWLRGKWQRKKIKNEHPQPALSERASSCVNRRCCRKLQLSDTLQIADKFLTEQVVGAHF